MAFLLYRDPELMSVVDPIIDQKWLASKTILKNETVVTDVTHPRGGPQPTFRCNELDEKYDLITTLVCETLTQEELESAVLIDGQYVIELPVCNVFHMMTGFSRAGMTYNGRQIDPETVLVVNNEQGTMRFYFDQKPADCSYTYIGIFLRQGKN